MASLRANEVMTLFIEGASGSLPNIHPKVLKLDLEKQVPDHMAILRLKVTKQRKILVLTQSTDTAIQILSLTKLAGIPVIPRIQYESITTRFLLFGIPVDVSCEDIADELIFDGIHVSEVRRFMRKSQGNSFPTTTVLITMIGTQLPPSVNVWYQVHKVSLFIDRPRPCLNCSRFNHSTKACRNSKICKNCATEHEGACTAPSPKCINCEGNHSSDDKSCPIYERELLIQRFKCENHLSIAEARRQFKITEEKDNSSYAAKAKSSPPSPSSNVLTKVEFQSALDSFAEHLYQLFQSVLVEQAASCRSFIDQATSVVVNAVQSVLPPGQIRDIPKPTARKSVDDLNPEPDWKKFCKSSLNINSIPELMDAQSQESVQISVLQQPMEAAAHSPAGT